MKTVGNQLKHVARYFLVIGHWSFPPFPQQELAVTRGLCRDYLAGGVGRSYNRPALWPRNGMNTSLILWQGSPSSETTLASEYRTSAAHGDYAMR
jgi:hypothetical protein